MSMCLLAMLVNLAQFDGTGLSALLNSPHGIVSFGNSLLICDAGNGVLCVFYRTFKLN